MTERRLDSAETHIAHLTRTVDELSDQVVRQGDQIDRLNTRLSALMERLSKQNDDGQTDTPLLEQRPPHW